MIISHLSPEYQKLRIFHNNGAFYYSKELVENIIPYIKTDRNWITINAENTCLDHSIVFIHNNKNPERYTWLSSYKDLILVCSSIKTLKTMIEMFPKFHSIFIPLSIDTEYVKKFKAKRKTKTVGYFGRREKLPESLSMNDKIEKIYGEDENRDELLKQVAKFKKIFAIGRCALEAKCLGCEVISHDGEYENQTWDLIDNKDVIPELQRLLDEIDYAIIKEKEYNK